MPDSDAQSLSPWMASATVPSYAPLEGDAKANVCVVGAGIAGLTTAYLLARAGKAVVVLDDGPIGGGQTQRTTAHLSNAIDDRYIEMERLHGQGGAKLAAQSHSAAIDRIESIVGAEQIDCDFERLDGYLFLGPGQSPELLDRERDAAHRAGLTDVEPLAHSPIGTGPCLRFPRQGQFHPLRYLAGLAVAIARDGGRIACGSHVEQVQGGGPARITVRGGAVVTADAVVVATNSPVNDRITMHTKQAPYLTYAIGARVPREAVPKGLYWDTLDPYHYVRLQASAVESDALLIVGGEDHKTGQTDEPAEARYARLEAWTRRHFPIVRDVAYRWSGQVMESVDGLAYIGHNPLDEPNVYIATGDSGMGMTHGTIAGILLTDLILGHANPWATLYDPARQTVRATVEMLSENVNVMQQYADWLTPGEVGSVDDISPGAGAVLRRGLHKVAVYRDEGGRIHERSATCPHLGCIVHWNGAEQTWDCPCHGSRFDRLGKVINGPANQDLPPVDRG